MVLGIEGALPEALHYPELDPPISLAAQGALRAEPIGDPLVGAAEHEDLDQLLEDDPVRDAGFVATARMVGLVLGQQSLELLEAGLLLR